MQCLTLKENFIFSCPIKLNTKPNDSESSKIIDANLLVTINALYIFLKTEAKSDEFLEQKLKLKHNHSKIYVESFKNESNEINYCCIDKKESKFSLKIEHPLAKEYIKILALFEGWKLAEKNTE